MPSDNTKPFQKHHIAVCGGDALVGIFMHHLTRFLERTDDPTQFLDDFGIAREGIARTRNDWAEELGATPKQIRRVLEKAEHDLQFMVRAQRGWGKYRVNECTSPLPRSTRRSWPSALRWVSRPIVNTCELSKMTKQRAK